ncbi:MAG: DUF4382 domain-containing protein [Steroidobacteraceae bacterium]
MKARQMMRSRGFAAGLALLPLALTGCEGSLTADLAAEAPADPSIAEVDVTLRGLEFERSDGGTVLVDFRDGEAVDLMDFIAGTPFRLFTDESLREGKYTGVRLAFEQGSDVSVVSSTGAQFDGRLEDGEFAAVDFDVKKDRRSLETLTLTLDLRRSLVFDDAAGRYVLTPTLRSIRTDAAAQVTGTIASACPAGSTLATGGAVYAFEGRGIEPDDLDRQDAEPLATAQVELQPGLGTPGFSLRFLPAGDYTLSLTCLGDIDTPDVDEQLLFGRTVQVSLDSGEAATAAPL